MRSRPQFSLRMLLFLLIMVCLGAATISPVPTGGELAEDAQNLLRASLTIAFPAMLATGTMHARGYWRTFFLGGLFPSASVLLLVWAGIGGCLAIG